MGVYAKDGQLGDYDLEGLSLRSVGKVLKKVSKPVSGIVKTAGVSLVPGGAVVQRAVQAVTPKKKAAPARPATPPTRVAATVTSGAKQKQPARSPGAATALYQKVPGGVQQVSRATKKPVAPAVAIRPPSREAVVYIDQANQDRVVASTAAGNSARQKKIASNLEQSARNAAARGEHRLAQQLREQAVRARQGAAAQAQTAVEGRAQAVTDSQRAASQALADADQRNQEAATAAAAAAQAQARQDNDEASRLATEAAALRAAADRDAAVARAAADASQRDAVALRTEISRTPAESLDDAGKFARIASGANNIAEQIRDAVQRATEPIIRVADAANRGGEAVVAATRGGTAAYATGDASTGLQVAAFTSHPWFVPVAIGGTALLLFSMSGKSGAKR